MAKKKKTVRELQAEALQGYLKPDRKAQQRSGLQGYLQTAPSMPQQAARPIKPLTLQDVDSRIQKLEQNRRTAAPSSGWAMSQAHKETQPELTRLKTMRNQMKAEQFERESEADLAKLTDDQRRILETLTAPKAPEPLEMQGVVDNRDWATRYAEEQARDEGLRDQLRQTGLSDDDIHRLTDRWVRARNKDIAEKDIAESRAYAEEHPVLASAKSVGQRLTAPLAAMSTVSQGVNRLLTGSDEPIDVYTPESRLMHRSSTARQTVNEKIDSPLGREAYNIGMSMADSGTIALMTAMGIPAPLGEAVLGSAAAQETIVEAQERGIEGREAALTGALAGIAEGFFERYSLDRLLHLKPLKGELKQQALTFARNLAGQSAVEGSEEMFTTIANSITDSVINGDLSEHQQNIASYVDNGATLEEAEKAARIDWAKGVARDAIGGAIAGGLMAGAGTGIHEAARRYVARQDLGPYADELTALAQEYSPDSPAVKRAMERQAAGKKQSGTNLLQMYDTAEASVDAANLEADRAAETALQARLTELGDEDAQNVAGAMMRQARGNMSTADAELLQDRETARTAGEELSRRTGWAADLPRKTSVLEQLELKRGQRINPNATDDRQVTGTKYNPKTETMDALVKGEDGTIEAVPMDEAKVTLRQEELASYAADYGEEGSTMMATIRPTQNVKAYAHSWELAYTYGKAGVNASYALSAERGGILTTEQRKIAYEAGMRAGGRFDAPAQRTARKASQVKRGRVSLRGATVDGARLRAVNAEGLTEKQTASIKAMQQIADATGIKVVFFESQVNEATGRRTEANGLYKDGTIYLDIAAGATGTDLADVAILRTASHELTHHIQRYNAAEYETLKEFVLNRLTESEGVDLETLIRRKIAREPDISREGAMDEVVADACEMMLRDSTIMEQLAREHETLAQRIRRWLSNFIENIKKAFAGVAANSEEAKAMERHAEELQKMWDKALLGAVENQAAEEDPLMTGEPSTAPMNVETAAQHSYRSLAEAAGFEAEEVDGRRAFIRNGKKVKRVTVADINNSPIGALVNYSAEMGEITEKQALDQKKMFADVCNMAINTADFGMVMQFAGSAIFTGMKANSDPQYGTTYDFPSICTKTQAVIDVMSARMVKQGRGLSDDEILQLYRGVFAKGNPVPCPECYVFSRWIGIGSLLQNMKDFQERYKNMSPEDVEKAYREMAARVQKEADEKGLSFGRAKGKIQKKLQDQYDKTVEKISKAKEAGNKISKKDLETVEKIEPLLEDVKALTWIDKVYFSTSAHKTRRKDAFVPDEVLFDLNRGEEFATNYKSAWAFRTTQGAGYGKAITPYAEARLGEGIYVTKSTSSAIKNKASGAMYDPASKPATRNIFLEQRGTLDKDARKQLAYARMKQLAQSFIGGQRFQSTSDARYENASDYLLAMLEMQAMHGMVQVYTKVDGAVPALAAWGGSINQSLMPYGNGLNEDGTPRDTTTGGMKPEVAFENREKFESAGTITIGVNDKHVRALIRQWVRDFVIPYHASGGKLELIKTMRAIQDGEYGKTAQERATSAPSADYTREQSEKVLSDDVLRWEGKTAEEIALIHARRDARIALLTNGKAGKMNQKVIDGSKYLTELQARLKGRWKGVQLTKGKVEGQIFPNEYWDESLTYEESGKITEDYLAYCEELGMLHKFSGLVPRNGELKPIQGWDDKGDRSPMQDLAYIYDEAGQKTDQIEPFFWKVLTDRRMYDNAHNYLPQKYITLSTTTAEDIHNFARMNIGRQYDMSAALEAALLLRDLPAEELEAEVDRIEQQTGRKLHRTQLSARGAAEVTVDAVEDLERQGESITEIANKMNYSDMGMQASLREGPPPKKVIKNVYKAFYAHDGKLYPPMVANLSDEAKGKMFKGAASGTMRGLETPVGVWIDADMGAIGRYLQDITEYDMALKEEQKKIRKERKDAGLSNDSKAAKAEILAESIRRVEEVGTASKSKIVFRKGDYIRNTLGRLGVLNAKSGGTAVLAFRPGWHLGEWPDAKQFNKDSKKYGKRSVMPDSLVFCRCEIAADVDYQLDAMEYGVTEAGKFNRSLAGYPYLPKDGYYKYRTNADPKTAPWFITGAMKVVEILDDDDCARICAKFGQEPSPRQSDKKINLEDYGLHRGLVGTEEGQVPPTENLERFRKSHAALKNEADFAEAMSDPQYAGAYTPRRLHMRNKQVLAEFERNRQDPEYYKALYEERTGIKEEPKKAKKTKKAAKKSVREMDREYMEAVEAGNRREAQELVFEAAKAAGYQKMAYHQTAAKFTEFDTRHELAGEFDTDTPTGLFFKPNDADIGLQGKIQMPVLLKLGKTLEFANREEAHAYWMENAPGYAAQQKKLDKITEKYDALYEEAEAKTDEWYEEHYDDMVAGKISDAEAMEAMDAPLGAIMEKWHAAEDPERRRLKELVNAYIRSTSYDSMHLKLDATRRGIDVEAYILFNPEDVKSAEPIQRDDAGEIIPLSERFNPSKKDIRYSVREEDTDGVALTEGQQKYFDKSKIRDEEGRLLVLYRSADGGRTVWNGRGKGTWAKGIYLTDEPAIAQAFASSGLGRASSESPIEVYANAVNPFVIDAEGRNYTDIPIPEDAPEWLKSHGAWDGTTDADNLPVYAFENGYDAVVIRNVREGVGGGAAMDVILRDSNQMKLTSNENPSENEDIRYSVREDPAITDREILSYALEESAQNEEERKELEFYRQMARRLRAHEDELQKARTLLQQIADGKVAMDAKVTEATKQKIMRYTQTVNREEGMLTELASKPTLQAVLERERENVEAIVKAGHVDRSKRYERSFERRLDQEMARSRAWKRQYQSAVWKRDEERGQRLKEKDAAKATKKREEWRTVRTKVEKKAARLQKMLVTNTDALHVPEDLKWPLGAFLETLDFSSDRLLQGGPETGKDADYAQKLVALREAVQNHVAGMIDGEESISGYLDLPDGFADRLREHIDAAREILADRAPTETVINRMSMEELQNLDMILSVLGRSITNINKLMANRRFGTAEKAALNTMRTMMARDPGATNAVSDFLLWDEALPVNAFDRLGEGGRSVFEALQDGWDKLAHNVAKVHQITEDIYTPEEAREWSEELHTYELYDADEDEVVPVQLTTAQLMSLWALRGRPQAKNHILGGGIRPEDIRVKIGKRGRKETIRQASHYSVTEMDLENMARLLTPRQRKVAHELQQAMEHQGSDWGNEISMERHGYKFFGEQGYFPIETDSQDRPERGAEDKDSGLYRLLNLSATKPLVPKAKNALILRNIFDVYSSHMADMAKYNALALPVLDALKWLNYSEKSEDQTGTLHRRNLRRAIEGAYGRAANGYIVTFLKDINGIKETGDRGDTIPKRMLSNYKRAVVAANLRVAMLQPTSYLRAAAVLDPKYLQKALTAKGKLKADIEEMQRVSGIGAWKAMGYFDTDVGRSMREQIKGTQTKLDALVEKSMFAAEKGDEMTWGMLWRACKLEAKAKGLEGDKLLKETEERFRDVVYRTQVVDSTMTRSHIMRSSSFWSKMFTNFMSEPTVTYNMVEQAFEKVYDEAKKRGMKYALQRYKAPLSRALAVYVASATVTALVEAFADALRDDDDDAFAIKWLRALGGWDGNLINDLNPLTKVPLAKDVVSLLQGYDVSRTEMEGIQTAVQAYKAWTEKVKLMLGLQERPTKDTYYGRMTAYGAMYKSAQALSQLIGVPLSSADREIRTMWNNTVGIVWPKLKLRAYANKEEEARMEFQAAVLAGGAQLMEARTDLEEDAMDAGATRKEAKRKADSKIRSSVKSLYLEGSMDRKKAEKLLRDYADQDDAEKLVGHWTCELDTGIKYDDIQSAYEAGEITKREAIIMRKRYGGETAEEAEKVIGGYDWEMDHPDMELSNAKVARYNEYAKPAGVSPKTFTQAAEAIGKMTAERDSEGKIVRGVKEQAVDYIQSLGLSTAQQRALWQAVKTASWTDKETPWE